MKLYINWIIVWLNETYVCGVTFLNIVMLPQLINYLSLAWKNSLPQSLCVFLIYFCCCCYYYCCIDVNASLWAKCRIFIEWQQNRMFLLFVWIEEKSECGHFAVGGTENDISVLMEYNGGFVIWSVSRKERFAHAILHE